MIRRVVKRGEAVAIKLDALHSDADAMWWDSGITIPPNVRCGSVEVVSVRGSLDHHHVDGGDSYEDIVARAKCAFAGIDANGEECGAPDIVVLRIDSPGGVVSGLNEAVFALRRMSKESGIRLVAYVDELAASAAYALACACEEILLPASAICGSIGVISTLYDQTAADEKMGLRFVTLTSGARKADGHPHVPLSDASLNAEQGRVDRLAKQFFNIVSEARALPVADVESYQAGIFLGKQAVAKRLADSVMSWDEALATLNDTGTTKKVLAKPASSTSPLLPGVTKNVTPLKEPRMLTSLTALVKRTTAEIASEKDAKKKKALTAALASYTAALEAMKKVKHVKEVHEEEESDDAGEESAEEEPSEKSEESKESSEEAAKEEGGDDSGDDEGDDDDKDEDDSESKKSASAAIYSLARQATGKTGRAAVGALAAMIAEGKRAAALVDEISKERRAEQKTAAISAALNARRVTRHEAKTLQGKPLSFVKSFLEMRPKAIINLDEESVLIPDPHAKAGSGANLNAEVMKKIDEAVAAAPDQVDRAKLRTSMIAAHEQRTSSGLNGAGGRY